MSAHTVIVCTRNRVHDMVRCLAALAQQQQPFDQLIVVDSSDERLDNDPVFVKAWQAATMGKTTGVYVHTAPGLPYQRNQGVARATGDIVYFLDDDACVAPDYLVRMAEAFDAHPACAGGMGDITNLPSQSRCSYYFYRFFGLHGPQGTGAFTWAGMTKQAYGAPHFCYVQSLNGCAAYRRKIFDTYLFDEKLPGRAALEDADMSWRVGQKHCLFFTPAARLTHTPSIDARESMYQFHKEHMRNYTYFFAKNVWPTGRWKAIAYLWAVLGLFVHACIKRDGQELRGYVAGLYQFFFCRFFK